MLFPFKSWKKCRKECFSQCTRFLCVRACTACVPVRKGNAPSAFCVNAFLRNRVRALNQTELFDCMHATCMLVCNTAWSILTHSLSPKSARDSYVRYPAEMDKIRNFDEVTSSCQKKITYLARCHLLNYCVYINMCGRQERETSSVRLLNRVA